MPLPIVIRQPITVTLISLRGLPSRLVSFWTALVGFAATAAVLTSILAIQAGFARALMSGGQADTAVITAAGAKTEIASVLTEADVRVVVEIQRNLDRSSAVLAAAEALTTVNLDAGNGDRRNIAFRGVQDGSFDLYPHVRITRGRAFLEGRNEVLVGSRLAAELSSLTLDQPVQLGSAHWTIVGVFESNGDLHESEIWADVRALQGIFGRNNVFQSMRVRTPSADSFQALQEQAQTDRRIDVQVQREVEFLAEQSGPISRFIKLVGQFIAALMGAGAAVSILTTMQTVVSERQSEIAILRILGYHRAAVVIAVVIEGVILGTLGGVIGTLIAYATLNGLEASTLAFGMTSQLYFSFAVTSQLMQTGVTYALGLGLLGTLLPAVQAVRRPMAEGMRC